MIEVGRHYHSCPKCRVAGFAADDRLALERGQTTRARQRLCLFGSLTGFARAAAHLKEVCGWTVSPNSLGRICHEEGVALERWRADAEAQDFQKAAGAIEMLVDGTMVNTVEDGWQETKLAAVIKRPSGTPAAAHEWDSRTLCKPTAVSFRAAIASADDFADDWRAWLASLGLTLTCLLTCFADGAKWIWARWAEQFPGARGVLDFFHLIEHVAATTREVFGERNGAVEAWLASARRRLLTNGWRGLCDWVGRLREAEPAAEKPTENLLAYAAPHLAHLDYPSQLAAGRPIGSGFIEGGCKQVVGKRLKQTGARWRTRHVRSMASLTGAHWADDWSTYWSTQIAL